MLKIIKVQGDSMLPCYAHNDYVVLIPAWCRALQKGDDVVCRHHHFGLILKRIYNITNNELALTGLNSSSTSRKMLGHVNEKDVLGRVLWHFKKHKNLAPTSIF